MKSTQSSNRAGQSPVKSQPIKTPKASKKKTQTGQSSPTRSFDATGFSTLKTANPYNPVLSQQRQTPKDSSSKDL